MKVLKNIFEKYHYLMLKMVTLKNVNDADMENRV